MHTHNSINGTVTHYVGDGSRVTIYPDGKIIAHDVIPDVTIELKHPASIAYQIGQCIAQTLEQTDIRLKAGGLK